jgi:hypothetical protein
MHHRRSARYLVLALLVVALSATGLARAEARIGSDLLAQLSSALPLQQLEIVVTFQQPGPARCRSPAPWPPRAPSAAWPSAPTSSRSTPTAP